MDIEVKMPEERWSGTLTYTTTNLVPILAVANYSVDFEFTTTPSYDMKYINGTGTASQTVNLSSDNSCWFYQNLDAPAILDLALEGYTKYPTNNLYIEFKLISPAMNMNSYYNYEACTHCLENEPDYCGITFGESM